MRVKVLGFLVFSLTLTALASFLAVILNTTPSSVNILVLLYASFFMFIFGITFLIQFLLYYLRHQLLPSWLVVTGSARLATVIGAFGTVLLALQSFRLLNFVTVIVLIVLFFIIELLLRRRAVKV